MKYLHNMKTVNYFDIKLTIEEHFKFLHTDPSGEVWASIKKPYIKMVYGQSQVILTLR